MKKNHLDEIFQAWNQERIHCDRYKENVTSRIFQDWIFYLKRNYSRLNISVIGTTFCENKIFALSIGRGSTRLQISAGMHANESINTNLLMAFIEKLLYILQQENDSILESFFQQFTLVFTPLVNPDGIDLLHAPEELPYLVYHNALGINGYSTDFSGWKSNVLGVDINNQFPARWELISSLAYKCHQPAPRDFPGLAPLTEKESIAMYRLLSNGNFHSVLCLHTQGEEFYWGFSDREPENSEMFAELYQAVIGYKGVRVLESYGGLKDWFIWHYGRLGITVELGLGVNPLPLSNFDDLLQKIDQILLGYLFFYV